MRADCTEQLQWTGSETEGEKIPGSAQLEGEEGLPGSDLRGEQRRTSKERDRTEERREGDRGGDYEEPTEAELATWQGQGAPRNSENQRLTSELRGKGPTENCKGQRQGRWNGESHSKLTYMEASIWEKQTWEIEPTNHRAINKAPRLGKWSDSYPNNDIDRIGSSYLDAEGPHTNRPMDVVWETQPIPKTTHKGSMYKDIMASIGLDSPNTSTETRGGENREHVQGASLTNTPIRNSASSLIALGKHIITPRQGKLWGVDTNPH